MDIHKDEISEETIKAISKARYDHDIADYGNWRGQIPPPYDRQTEKYYMGGTYRLLAILRETIPA